MDLSCRISKNLYRYSAFKEEEDTPLLLKPGLLLVISFLECSKESGDGRGGWVTLQWRKLTNKPLPGAQSQRDQF
jgi:hypothetical protein